MTSDFGGVATTNKFAFLQEDEDPAVLLERAQKEKKEKAKQAKLASKKAPEVQTQVSQPAAKQAPTSKDRKQRTDKPSQERRGERKEKREGGRQSDDRRPANPGNCYNCGGEGHLSRDCPEERKPREDKSERKPRQPLVCRECNEEGHIARECPQKPERKPRQSLVCRECNEEGHFARDCPQKPERKPRQPLTCHECSEEGHIARECPRKQEHADENTVPKPAAVEGEEATDEQVEDEGAPKLTLAEWKAQQKQEKVVFKPREAERNDKNLEKFEVLKRDDGKSGEDYEYEEIEVQSKRAQATRVLDIDVNFQNSARGPRRDERRPGQSANRGNNTRGGQGASGSGQQRRQQPARLNMANDFPELK